MRSYSYTFFNINAKPKYSSSNLSISIHSSKGSSAANIIFAFVLSSLKLSKIQLFSFDKIKITGNCKLRIFLIGFSIIVVFNPARKAALENKDLEFVLEKSIWLVRFELIGKPDNKDSEEKGLWNNLVYKTKDSNKVSLFF